MVLFSARGSSLRNPLHFLLLSVLYVMLFQGFLIFTFIHSKGEQGQPGVSSPGQKGEKVSADVFVGFVSFNIFIMQTHLVDSLAFPRASVVCVNHQRLAGYLLISKCQWEQKAVKVNQALRGHQDLQVLGLKANRYVSITLIRSIFLESKNSFTLDYSNMFMYGCLLFS